MPGKIPWKGNPQTGVGHEEPHLQRELSLAHALPLTLIMLHDPPIELAVGLL